MKQYKIVIIAMASIASLLLCNNFATAGNTSIESFDKSKRLLLEKVYFDHQETIYCKAKFDKHKNIQLPSGFKTPAHEKRSHRVEWEHSVPAENFGRAFAEWRDGNPMCVDKRNRAFKGRKCAEISSQEYRYMQADMYNLFPAIGSVNALRSNYQYSELPWVEPTFGMCPAKIDDNRFEPPSQAKGELARAALYMSDNYPRYRLSRQQQQLFEVWDKKYPVTQWECTRCKRIEKLQGNENSRVKRKCQEAGLW